MNSLKDKTSSCNSFKEKERKKKELLDKESKSTDRDFGSKPL